MEEEYTTGMYKGRIVVLDNNENSQTVETTKEDAIEKLKTLVNCYGCHDCENMTESEGCINCCGCTRCMYCYFCYDSSDCFDSSNLQTCTMCFGAHHGCWNRTQVFLGDYIHMNRKREQFLSEALHKRRNSLFEYKNYVEGKLC